MMPMMEGLKVGLFRRFFGNESGATAMEYGLAALLISVVAISTMRANGEQVNNLYVEVEGAVSEVADN